MTRHLRPATADDAEALGGLLGELWEHYGEPASVPDARALWFPDRDPGPPAPLLILDGPVPVGFAVYRSPHRSGGVRITHFSVTAAARGTGAGAALYAHLGAIATELGSRLELPPHVDPEVFVVAERYERAIEGRRAYELREAEERQALALLCADRGWPAPRVDQPAKTGPLAHGDLLAEGEVPFIELSDGRIVTARFQRTWREDDKYPGPEAVTRWSLALDGSALAARDLLLIEFAWTGARRRPDIAVRAADGTESVTYSFYEGIHSGSTVGTITYTIDPTHGTVHPVADLHYERD